MTALLRKYQGILCILFIAAIYAAIQTGMPHHTFWSNDGGEKLVQVKSLIENNFSTIALPYDRLGIEPAGSFDFAPFYPVHARLLDGRLVPVVPVYFPLLSTLPFLLWGHAGLYIIPFVASVLLLWCLLVLCRSRFGPLTTGLTLTGAGLGTSLFFYSLTFWEHVPAACLGLVSVVLIATSHRKSTGRMSRRILLAGFCISLGAWIRGDVYFLIGGLLAGILAVRQYRWMLLPFLAGLAAGLTPFYLVNHFVYAATAGPQIADIPLLESAGSASVLLEAFGRQWDTIRYFLLTYTGLPAVDLVFILIAAAPALIRFQQTKPHRFDAFITLWTALLVFSVGATLFRLFLLQDPMSHSMNVLGLFASIPFLPFAFFRPRFLPADAENGLTAFLLTAALVTLAGYCLGLPSRGGLQWGPRYTLPLFPILIFLSMQGFDRIRSSLSGAGTKTLFTALFILLICSGIIIQSFGVHLLFSKKNATAGNISRIRTMAPKVIITDTWWVPEDNGVLYPEIPMYTFYNLDKMGRLLTRLDQRGERELLLVSPIDYRNLIASQPGLALESFLGSTHDKMPMFDLNLHKIRLTGSTRHADR